MGVTRGFAVVGGLVFLSLAGCGAGSPEGAPAAPPAAALAPGAIPIYEDALAAGWVDWSWSTTRNFAATSPVAAGARSLAVTYQPWGGLSLHRNTGPVSGMSAVVLSVYGSAAGVDLQVYVSRDGTSLPGVLLAQHCAGRTIPAGAWTRCSVPMSALAPAGTAIDGIGLRDVGGVARPTIYLDDVGLVPAAPPAPTGLAATVSGGAVSLSWTAAARATGYDVYRSTAAAGPFTRLTGAAQAATSYTDRAVAAGATYWYQVTASNAGGTSARSAAVSAAVPATQAPAATLVYADALGAGWVDWSWGSTRNFAATSPVASGTRSIAVTFQAWGGLSLHLGTGTVSGASAVTLAVNGGAVAGNDLLVYVSQAGQSLPGVLLAQHCEGRTIPAGAWTRCSVPMSALAPAGTAIDGVGLRETAGVARATMYVDDIALGPSTGGGGTTSPTLPAAPAGLAASPSAGRVSLSWGAVAGATGYDVFRAASSAGPFAKLTAAPQAATTYADGAVAAGTTYWYQVRAVNAAGTSAPSATVSAAVPAAPVAVTLSPAATSVDACRTARFAATVTGSSDPAVTWSVQEGAAGGTIDAAGTYTAPNAAGTFHVVATSRTGAAVAVAAVTVQHRVLAVAVVPAAASVAAGAEVRLTANVTTTCGTFPAQ
ncbi:MAG TPA: fibronectin type III domain-containing protein [Anaeromyxobacter sp.]|nr:fibronectin type III domain-containing protein [Anaeromyxobacter sp.]